MIRAFATIVLPLLLPTVLYILWVFAMRRAEAAGVHELLRGLPWPWLSLAGLALVAGTLALLSLGFGSNLNGVYVPPSIVNGKLVPAHREPAPAPAR